MINAGTDIGPACARCSATIYHYTGDPADPDRIHARCVSCNRVIQFRPVEISTPIALSDGAACRLAHESAARTHRVQVVR